MTSLAVQLKGVFSSESADGRISNRAKSFLAFPAMPVTIGNVLIHNAYIKYYSDVIGLDVSFVGVIYLVFGIWNAINDPMMGVVIDRFRYTPKRGKYVYFMRVTAPMIVLSSFAMLFSQPAWNEWVIFAVFLVLLFIFDTAQTAYSIAYASYVLVAAPSKEERVDVSIVGSYVAIVVGSLPTALGFLSLYFVQNFSQVMLAYWVIIVGSQFSNLSQRPMLGAIIDQDEQQTGVRKAGLFAGLNALLTIPVSGIQAAVFTMLISRYGFVSGATTQSARALAGIRLGAGVIPFFFVLLGIVPIFISPINRVKEQELSDFAEERHRLDVQDQPQAVGG